MLCPSCSATLRVSDTRAENGVVRRVRVCPSCGKRLRTIEIGSEDAARMAGRIGQQRKKLIDGLERLLAEVADI